MQRGAACLSGRLLLEQGPVGAELGCCFTALEHNKRYEERDTGLCQLGARVSGGAPSQYFRTIVPLLLATFFKVGKFFTKSFFFTLGFFSEVP